MIKVSITWSKSVLEWETQEKSFADENKALEWCRKNQKHIVKINDSPLFLGDTISHFEIMKALRMR